MIYMQQHHWQGFLWVVLSNCVLCKVNCFSCSTDNYPGDARDVGLIPGWERSPGEGNGNPLIVLPENSMDRGAWRTTVHGVAKSWPRRSAAQQNLVHIQVTDEFQAVQRCRPCSTSVQRCSAWWGAWSVPQPRPVLPWCRTAQQHRSPVLFQSSLYTASFYERPTLAPALAQWKKSEEDFHFYKKEKKQKAEEWHSALVCSRVALTEAVYCELWGAPPSSFPGTVLSTSASFAPPLWAPVLYLDLFCAWLSKMCLKQLLLHFVPFQLMETFTRMLYFWIMRETCVYIATIT